MLKFLKRGEKTQTIVNQISTKWAARRKYSEGREFQLQILLNKTVKYRAG